MRLKYNKLSLGCGSRKPEGHVGIDLAHFDYPKGEFIRGDVFKILRHIKSNSIENITSEQFLEHIPKDKFIGFINECYRILKVHGEFEATFPPAIAQDGMPNPEFYADPWHINAILPGTFFCFSKTFRQQMADKGSSYKGYGITADFEIREVKWPLKSQVYISLQKDARIII